ncbi:MAG: polysaccharide deacetylase family protein [Myxococcota bacterium]
MSRRASVIASAPSSLAPLVRALALVASGALAAAGCAPADDDAAATSAGFEQAFEQTDLGKEDSAGCSGVVVPDKSGFAKRVALTFDDGPNAATTPQVLDILAEHGIKATFFLNGSRVRGDAEKALIARMLAEGHIVGNHSQHHYDLKTLTLAKVKVEMQQTDDILRANGVTPKFFRFPFGSASCGGLDLVKGKGYTVTGWHVDSGDWCFAASGTDYCKPSTFKWVPDQYRHDLEGYVMSQVHAKDGGIILFHDIHANTVAHLDSIISELENEGYTFVRVDDTTTFPRLNNVAPPAPKWVGDSCQADKDCNFSSSAASASCYRFTPAASAEVGFCTLPCEGFCPDKTGASPTFCTSLDGGLTGRCVAKASAVNRQCAAIAGTSATTAPRFIGSSAAAPTSAIVCMPQ